MRISTSTLYDVNVAALNQQQGKLLHTQQQISSGRRLLTPADDPAAAARALIVSQSDATNTQYAKNLETVQHSVAMSENVMQSVTTLLQDVRTAAVSAGNAVLSNADRRMMATDLQGRLDELISLANTTDGLGNYLFSGFQGKTQPFANTAGGTQYMGDDGQRMIQVTANRQLAAADSGANIFMRIRNGNGTFTAQADPTSNAGLGNTGSGIISAGSVANPPPTAADLGNTYTLSFSVVAGVTTYSVTGLDALGAPVAGLPAAQPYVSGQAISFKGIQFDIQGAPANGDQFTIAPSKNESMFKTISDLINTLNTPVVTNNVASLTQLTANLGHALNGLDRGLDSVSSARASMGSRLVEVDSLRITGADLGIQYKETLSLLQDVDYNQAISDLTMQQTMLTAAQKSFMQVQNLSMFNYLP